MNKKHIKCWLWKILWGLAAAALISAWLSVVLKTAVVGIDPAFLLWNALILSSLAIAIKLDCTSCTTCEVPKV
ncbi:hypothetical protein EBR66_00895 [bacterium]|nr:hypothetical protein [bacterium]